MPTKFLLHGYAPYSEELELRLKAYGYYPNRPSDRWTGTIGIYKDIQKYNVLRRSPNEWGKY